MRQSVLNKALYRVSDEVNHWQYIEDSPLPARVIARNERRARRRRNRIKLNTYVKKG